MHWNIVVLNWNQAEITADCLASIDHAQAVCPPGLVIEKVLVDNGSLGHELTAIKELEPQFNDWNFLFNPYNAGFAAGMNVSIRSRLKTGVSHFLLVNNDCIVSPDLFIGLYDHINSHPHERISGVVLKNNDGSFQSMGAYRYFPIIGLAVPIRKPRALSTKTNIFGVDYVSGALMLVASSLLERTKGVPQENFLYFEELLLTQSLQDGETIGTCINTSSIHAKGQSSVSNDPAGEHPSYHAALACFRFTRRYYPAATVSAIATRIFGLFIRSIFRGSLTEFYAGLRATRDSRG